MKDMLKVKEALGLIGGPLGQFWTNVQGENGDEWFTQYCKFLRGEPTWMVSRNDFSDLEFIDCLIFPETTNGFVPKEHLKTSMRPPVFIVDELRDLIDRTIDEGPEKGHPLRIYDWHRKLMPNLANLAVLSPSSFQDIWCLLQKQLNGQQGKLMVYYRTKKERRANIFFVEDLYYNIKLVTLIYNEDGWILNFLTKQVLLEFEEFRIFLR